MIPSNSTLPLRCWAEIDLAAIERNLRLIRGSLPAHIRYVAVVKADAYGHGLQHVAGRLMHAGADLFAVANITEAAQLRELGPGWPILLLSPLLPDEDRFARRIRPGRDGLDGGRGVRAWTGRARPRGGRYRCT